VSNYRKKLIEVAMPLEAINKESAREKSIRHGHPSTLHLWWARRPLASCRAVLFGQLVDDPSSWPDRFPTEKEQDAERKRIFGILEELVLWENSNNERVLNAARKEIAQSLARNRQADGEGNGRDEEVLIKAPKPEVINAYLAEEAPPVHDPFAGGGSIPLEAQRLGLRAIATDLNPVAVLINKALIEIPPKFAGREPVHPEADKRTGWKGAEGLAEDVRRYGEWMRDEAQKRIGYLYPDVDLPEEHGGGKATVIAWLWARTVESPDPAFKGVHVPLVRSFMLSTKKGKQAWVEPVFSEDRKSYRFEIRTGEGKPEVEGTVARQGGVCLASGDSMPFPYIRGEGQAGRMGVRLMAVVAKGNRKRIYLPPTDELESPATVDRPADVPDAVLPNNPRDFKTPNYGLRTFADLFTNRQLVALTTFSDLVPEARDKAIANARAAGWGDDGKGLEEGGTGATAYGDALATYIAFGVSRLSNRGSTICMWNKVGEKIEQVFARQAIPMMWDFAESNPLGGATGNWVGSLGWIPKVLERLPRTVPVAEVAQMSAADVSQRKRSNLICSDPPYYDNIGYADLSDYFYVWLRRCLGPRHSEQLKTILVPKKDELIASPYRHGGKEQAEKFFLSGMTAVMLELVKATIEGKPLAIFYAFKQAETDSGGTASTGWATFLDALLTAGLGVVGTWPLRTERDFGVKSGTNVLASSLVLVCRKREANAPTITRGDFNRVLKSELPAAIAQLEKGNVAPVDMAQASIGPGMAIFSHHAKVIEADGSAMTVQTALQLINEVVDEVRAEEESDFDADTRFAITWFEQYGFKQGPFGEAEVLATARAVSVIGVEESGVLRSAAGKARLVPRAELPADWDPTTDTTLTVWECTQHLIKRLGDGGEQAAADLLRRIGPRAEAARTLAYRLFTHCERKGDAEEAKAYNGLVLAWTGLERLAAADNAVPSSEPQSEIFN
jgi:putative DNA methylase